MIQNKSKETKKIEEFEINELFISWLISALMIIGIMNLKTSCDLNKQKSKTIEAMSVAVEINNQKELLDEQNNRLLNVVIMEKNFYKSELNKKSKYESIIKDIDRTWNQPK
jgi:hypothetical protein